MTWKTLPEFEGLYEASTCGQVRSIDGQRILSDGRIRPFRGRVLKQWMHTTGYWNVMLSKNSKAFALRVHALVLKTFVGPRPPRFVCNHKGGNKLNNGVSNLEWVTYSRNMKHAVETGLTKTGEDNSSTRISRKDVLAIRELAVEGRLSQSTIARLFKTTQQTVSTLKLGIKRTYDCPI